MDEHDDDLESQVNEDAEEETDAFPDTDDELGDAVNGEEKDEGPELDDDQAEL
jgi:hypothetical protein